MKKNYPGTFSCFKPVLFLVVFLFFGFSGFGQTISQPKVSGTPVCGGSSVELTFTITNGNNQNKHFSSNAVYEIYDDLSGDALLNRTFEPGVAPTGDNASLTFTITVNIPNDPTLYPSNTNYRFYIFTSSQNVTSPYSDYFTVSNPTLSFSGETTICKGETFNITGNLTGIGSKNVVVRNSLNETIGSGSFTDAFSFSRTIDTTTTYYFEVTDEAGCTIYEELTIQVLEEVTPPQATNSGPICIGGTINLYASSISGATYSWTGPNGYTSTAQNPSISDATAAMAGTYSVVATVNGCSSEPATTLVEGNFTIDNETATGNDSWIGHIYDGTNQGVTYDGNFTNYVGSYTETELFDQDFTGDVVCFPMQSGGSILTENFSIRYRMNSTKKGLYIVDLGTDNGTRLNVDGDLVYTNWIEDWPETHSNVLFNLTGQSSLVYDYFEVDQGNNVIFNNLLPLIENNLTQNISQTFTLGGSGQAISGDTYETYGTLPAGISRTGTGYQWSYSTTPGGARTNISGATDATFTPASDFAPFNVPGTYYLYRQANLTSSNNTGITSYQTSNSSNTATITVAEPTSCSYEANTFNNITHTPCISIPNGYQVVSSNMPSGSYFLMDVVKGLTYQVFTGDDTTGPTEQHSLSIYREGYPEAAIAYSYENTGNPFTTVNNVSVTFTPDFSGQVRILTNVAENCSASASSLIMNTMITGGNNSQDDPLTSGTDNWIGHVYDGISFDNYLGYYNESQEAIDLNFGGDFACFPLLSDNTVRANVYTESFSVRYRMNSTRTGLYVVDMGSDDGSRLRVDGNLVYNNWQDQAYSIRPRVLMNFNGNSSLTYEFYENSSGNQVSFDNITLVLTNQLTENIEQVLCASEGAMQISGDVYGTLPAGISTSGTGYQWSYSTSPNGNRTDIAGATDATFTPDITTAPFNNAGTYYIFRKAILVSTNNTGFTSYTATNESNPAILNVDEPISNNTISETGTICATKTETWPEITDMTITAPPGTVFTSVEFASWGTPEGTCGNFSFSTCHATTSQAVVEGYLLGNNSATIPLSNDIFGDPCSNTTKRLYVQATYGPPEEICRGDEPTITGSTPAGGENPLYLWETSISGPDTGFSAGPGTNDTKDYAPGPLDQTTWIRRQVTNSCGVDISNVIEIKVDVPTAELSGSMEICAGETVDLTATFTGAGPWDFTLDSGGTTSSFQGVESPYIISVNPSVTTSYTITSITSSGGCVFETDSNTVTVTVTEDAIWTGTTSTDWNTTSNWECNTLPTLETNVLIPENLVSNNYPVINTGANALAKKLTIENTASVTVIDNWLRIADSLSNAGVLNTETGSVSFEGPAAQTIPMAAFQNNRIQNLNINNTSGVISQAIIEVTGVLKIENGNFDTGNDLTLISDTTQTALIDGSGNGEVIGLVSMQRYLDRGFGYKYFSSPFQNSVVGDFAPYMDFQDPVTGFPHFYRYNENRRIDSLNTDATGWEVYTNTTDSLNIAEGYALNFGTSIAAQTIEIIGEVNNGTITSRQLSNNHRKYTKGFHLVGNPYPSPINWDATQGWTKNNIDDGIYFFTASDTSQYTGTYTAYVNQISTSDGQSSNIIPSMQGFFIKVSDSDTQDLVTGSFGMDNNVRINDFDQEFLRTQEDLKSIIRLEAGYKISNRKDPMVIYFSSYATPNFEKEMDAHKLMNTDPAVPSFYNLTEDKKELAINAIPYPESKSYKKIPLGIKADQNGEMKINLASVENMSPNFNIYLIDHQRNIGQNLRKDSDYSFNIKAGIHNSRFELMFSEEEVTSPAIAFNEPFEVEVENGNVVVKLNLEENQEGILRASTMTGQILQIKEAGGKDQVIFEGITSEGVYIINLQVGKAYYGKKVLIKK